jgi:hypothetical protein
MAPIQHEASDRSAPILMVICRPVCRRIVEILSYTYHQERDLVAWRIRALCITTRNVVTHGCGKPAACTQLRSKELPASFDIYGPCSTLLACRGITVLAVYHKIELENLHLTFSIPAELSHSPCSASSFSTASAMSAKVSNFQFHTGSSLLPMVAPGL